MRLRRTGDANTTRAPGRKPLYNVQVLPEAPADNSIDAATPDPKEPRRPKKPDATEDDVRVSKYGTDPSYALARLRRDNPNLHARVLAGELSPHRAAILAGYRKELSPLERILKLVPKLTDKEWAIVVAEWSRLHIEEPSPPPALERMLELVPELPDEKHARLIAKLTKPSP
jgi:hypothetical protein